MPARPTREGSVRATRSHEGNTAVPTLIVALLVVAALVLLATSVFGGRRDRDPSSSVHSFQRALHAMGNEPAGTARDRDDADGRDDDAMSRR